MLASLVACLLCIGFIRPQRLLELCMCVFFHFLSVRSNGQVITAVFNEMDFTQTIKHTNGCVEILCVCLKATPPLQTASKFQGSGFSVYRPWVDKRSNACKAWVFQDTVSLNGLYFNFLTDNSLNQRTLQWMNSCVCMCVLVTSGCEVI